MAIECLRIHRRPLKDSCWQVKILSIGENGEHPCMYKQGISKEVNTITLFLSFRLTCPRCLSIRPALLCPGNLSSIPKAFGMAGMTYFGHQKEI